MAVNTPALGEVVAAHGQSQMMAFVETNIAQLALFCNLGASINPDQIQATARMIVEEFGNLTIADVNLIFRRAKLGGWGELYGRLDGQRILSWFGKYLDERCEYCAEQSQSGARGFKGDYLPTTANAQRARMELDKLLKAKRI